MSQRWIQDFIDLAEEQGFRVLPLTGRGSQGVRVMPKLPPGDTQSQSLNPVILYTHCNDQERDNKRAALRRIGVVFPEDRSKQVSQTEEHAQPKPARDPIAIARNLIDRISSDLSELEGVVTEIAQERGAIANLKATLRQLGL
jgi:hypothetical protein